MVGGGAGIGGSSGGSGSRSVTSAAGGDGKGDAGASSCSGNRVASCRTESDGIVCHFGGNPGNYEVAIELGGASEGHSYVEAEASRRMLAETTTSAGQTKRYSFVVNVRHPEGEPIQDVASGTPGLDIYVRGSAPMVTSICEEPISKPVMVFLAGDSTVCDQSSTDYAGWGQHLPQHFLSPVSVANYADSGESSASFAGSASLWGAIKSRLADGDWVLIQFGHNDKSTTEAAFRSNLTKMVNDTKAAHANPVLITPTSRVGYGLAEEHVNSVGVDLPAVVRDLGASLGVPVIDLTTTTWNWLQGAKWQDYFALGTDRTHTNPKGGEVIAGFVRDAVKAKVPDLAVHLR